MKILFLGTGTSVGVPQIGCECPVCRSRDPRDRRRRCAVHVSSPGGSLLVDTPPELRLACIELSVKKVDALLLTHAHMDHVAGFDDVRRFNTLNGRRVPCDPSAPGANGRTFRIEGAPLECRALPETVELMRSIFPYVSSRPGERGLYRPQVVFSPVEEYAPFRAAGFEVEAIRVEHGFPCCGYVISRSGRSFGYFPDCHAFTERAVERLRGVDLLAVDCLREREHPTHFTLSAALAAIDAIKPRKALLTHMCHDLTHAQYLERLPAGVEPAWDGLEVEI